MEVVKNTEELVKRTELKDSPFTVVETDGKIFGTIGNYRVTEECESVEQCAEECLEINWNRILQVVMILQEKQVEISNLIKGENED